MKHILLVILLLIGTIYAKSSRGTPGGMRNSGWGSPTKRPGSSGSARISTPSLSPSPVKINTNALSNPNRGIVAAKPPAVAPAPIRPVAPVAPPVKIVQNVPGKINTSSLSDPARPKVVVADPPKVVAAAVPPKPTPAPVVAPVQTKQVTIVKHTYVNHRYDNGYSYTPAPIIVVAGHPTYHYHDHDYPLVLRNGAYYADVDGRQMEFAQADGGWGTVAPVPVAQPVVAPAPAPRPAVVPAPAPKSLEVKNSFEDRHPIIHAILMVALVFAGTMLAAAVGYFIYKLIRGDDGK